MSGRGIPEPLSFAGAPTPLSAMPRLAARFGLEQDRLWVKRDDLTALGGGGNKARKLEFLCADALRNGATTLVTGGAVQSNHVRATGAAAAMCGLRAVGVVGGRRGALPEGNVVLDAIFDIELVYANEHYAALDLESAIDAQCDALKRSGEVPYRIPLGGSSTMGAQGYVRAADELEQQLPGATVFVADGTGGTHAGLAAGFGDHDRVRGVDVGAMSGLAGRVASLAIGTAKLAGRDAPIGTPRIDSSQVGDGYARSTPQCLEAIRLAGRSEGLVLDPVYTAKAFAALLSDAADDALPEGPVVFLHSGGLPGLLVARHAVEIVEA